MLTRERERAAARAAKVKARLGYDARQRIEGRCRCCRRWVDVAARGPSAARLIRHGGGWCGCPLLVCRFSDTVPARTREVVVHLGCGGYVVDGECDTCWERVTVKPDT